jgi:hypothetical protein
MPASVIKKVEYIATRDKQSGDMVLTSRYGNTITDKINGDVDQENLVVISGVDNNDLTNNDHEGISNSDEPTAPE